MFLPLNTFENICVCFLLLMIYSTIGWVAEMIYHSIVIGHMSEKRGFLNGFLCPIYGHGALLVLYVLHGGLKNPILTFLAGMVLTSALGYELKPAVGTSVFIMTFTAFTGAVSHVAIGGGLDVFALTVCVVVTLLGARIAAVFANRASAKALNRVTGVVLTILGAVMVVVNLLS